VSETAMLIESRIRKAAWQKYGTPAIVLALAVALIVTITRNWNGWREPRRSRPLMTLMSARPHPAQPEDLRYCSRSEG